MALDLPGHGLSNTITPDYSLDTLIVDLTTFIEELNLKKIHVIGFSLGAALALKLAQNNQLHIKSLVLISGFSQVERSLESGLTKFKQKLEESYESFFEEAVQMVNTPDFILENKEIINELKAEKAKTASPESLIHIIDDLLKFDVSSKIDHLECPVLIISGREDMLCDLRQGEELYVSIKDSQWLIKDKVGHNILIPSLAEEISGDIGSFLEKIDYNRKIN